MPSIPSKRPFEPSTCLNIQSRQVAPRVAQDEDEENIDPREEFSDALPNWVHKKRGFEQTPHGIECPQVWNSNERYIIILKIDCLKLNQKVVTMRGPRGLAKVYIARLMIKRLLWSRCGIPNSWTIISSTTILK